MRLTTDELAKKYDTDYNVVSMALVEEDVRGKHEPRNNVLHLTYDEEEATEAMGSYIATKLHESYMEYAKWKDCAKRFDAKIMEVYA